MKTFFVALLLTVLRWPFVIVIIFKFDTFLVSEIEISDFTTADIDKY